MATKLPGIVRVTHAGTGAVIARAFVATMKVMVIFVVMAKLFLAAVRETKM